MSSTTQTIQKLYNVLPAIFPGEKMENLRTDGRSVRFKIGGDVYRCDISTLLTEVSKNYLLHSTPKSQLITKNLKNQ